MTRPGTAHLPCEDEPLCGRGSPSPARHLRREPARTSPCAEGRRDGTRRRVVRGRAAAGDGVRLAAPLEAMRAFAGDPT
jgi:hypothetical protein